MSISLATVLGLTLCAASAQASTVPAVVVSATGTVNAPGLASNQAEVALDACGNIYSIESYDGTVFETPAGGGTPTTVLGSSGVNYDPDYLGMDAAKKNLFVTWGPYNMYAIPIVNCVAQPNSKISYSIGNLGAISYYFSASAMTGDSSGNVFIATNVACCAAVNELLEEDSAGNGTTLIPSLNDPITSMVVDASGNIYYVSGGALYELAYSGGAYSATPTSFGSGYNSVAGVGLDALGNLYVSDNGSSTIFEVPFESTALNPSDQFVVASGISINSPVASDPSGNLYFTTQGSTIYELSRNSANLGSIAVGSGGITTLNLAFNAAEIPAAIQFAGGGTVFSTGAGSTCAAGTAQAAGSSCTIAAQFAPAVPGLANGALLLKDSSENWIAEADLYGTGLGAGLTADPGSPVSVGSGFATPASVARDVAGNVFIADAGNSSVWEIAAGGTTPVALGTGLSSPKGVAVDGAGNVYVADTGNNRIVEIPVINGALSSADQITIAASGTALAGSALNAPAGVSTDAAGNLYIADTGNNRVLFLPQEGGWNPSTVFALGSGWSSPLATTVTSTGLIYIADSGHGKVYSIPVAESGAGVTLVATGFSNPSALATDAAGDLFVVDQGNGRVLRIPNLSGSLAVASAADISIGIANPYGLALDSAGNLYVSDGTNSAAYAVSRTTPTQAFGKWTPGTTSDPLTYQVENAGNQPLTFYTPFYAAAGNTAEFAELSGEANACANATVVAAGASCAVEATFTPADYLTYQETLTLSSNATNAAALALSFTGVGAETVGTTTTLAVTSPSGAPSYGQAIALSVSVASTVASSGTPVGSVALLVDGTQTATATLSNGAAKFSLANGLTGGSHTLQAVYQGADSGNITYSLSSSAVITIVVSAVPTSTTASFTTLYANPASQPAGTPIALVATVSSTHAGVPTGAVVFAISVGGAAPVNEIAAVQPSTGGLYQATYSFTPPAPAAGSAYSVVSFVATYQGDPNFASSASPAASFDVSPTTGSVSFSASGTSVSSSAATQNAITITTTSYGGWTGVVGFTCDSSTLPAHARCVFSPGQATVFASAPGTTFPPAAVQFSVAIDQPVQTPTAGGLAWWLGGITGLLLFRLRRRMKLEAWSWLSLLIAAAMLTAGFASISGCASGDVFKTPAGSSTVKVYASADPYTAGSTTTTQPCPSGPAQSPCVQQAFSMALTVQ